MGEGTTRRGTDNPVHHLEKPAGSTHSSTRAQRRCPFHYRELECKEVKKYLEEQANLALEYRMKQGTVEVAGPLGTPLGLAQRKRASPRGEAGTSGFLCVSDSDRRKSWQGGWERRP